MGAGQRFEVDPRALGLVGAQVGRLADELGDVSDAVLPPALSVLDALPPSDLFEAYAFCWGRWSRAVQDAEPAVRSAARGRGVGAPLRRRGSAHQR